MRVPTSSLLTALATALLGSACSHAPEPTLSDLPRPDLPDLVDYKVDPYIRMALALQSLDRPAALNKLHPMARAQDADFRVIILSRMLFAPRPGASLRPPEALGMATIGPSPQWPIEVVDGVPFLIAIMPHEAHGPYKGPPETDEEYLQYCETNGDWSAFHYSVKTVQQKREALTKLLKRLTESLDPGGLSMYERTFLANQIE
jgi:hypothetical protein